MIERLVSTAWARYLLLLTLAAAGPLPGLAAAELKAKADVAADQPFQFRNVGAERGALPHLSAMRAHGAAWVDLDGDGWPELFVTTFHNAGSGPAVLLRNDHGKFK